MGRTAKLGVLQLKTTFPRPAGDVGNPLSWGDIPVVIRVVEEADSDLVVGGGWGEEMVDAFVREAEKMRRDEGCVAFVTSCGFVSGLGLSFLSQMFMTDIARASWQRCIRFSPPDCPSWAPPAYYRSRGYSSHSSLDSSHPSLSA